ncbi:unnamed protein product [Allacma fusca]|uniref:Chitin-binding type-2 domain-containing protein n=1 Tax=Allacma fusca TaxID=39272 RepID=A0A8J2NLX3_9HEXA|nr:unnamed protein product [Allacma fusca]
MTFNLCITISAILFVSKTASPDAELMGVSLRVGVNLCTTFQPQDKLGSKADSLISSGSCAWVLNRDSWTSVKGKKGIWQVACSSSGPHGSSAGDKNRGNLIDISECDDPCNQVPPSKASLEWVNLNLPEGCKIGDITESTYCRNYYECVGSGGSTVWKEKPCGDLYFDPSKKKCSDFKDLTMSDKEKYCIRGCVPSCANSTFPKTEWPPWEDGPPDCSPHKECSPNHKKNSTEYCRNYHLCELHPSEKTRRWKQYVCDDGLYWYQREQCDGLCVPFANLPRGLREYYKHHPCCHVPKPCDCELRGYCRDFEMCVDGEWGSPGRCIEDLYWLPNNITGGTCAHFENLPNDLQLEYKNDKNCYKCEWYQTANDVCSPRYTFIDENLKKHNLTCPRSPSGEQLYWQLVAHTCDVCWNAVDYYGGPCKC